MNISLEYLDVKNVRQDVIKDALREFLHNADFNSADLWETFCQTSLNNYNLSPEEKEYIMSLFFQVEKSAENILPEDKKSNGVFSSCCIHCQFQLIKITDALIVFARML
ncbi:20912_t:CDS:1 [Gigaspora rosea]|nr:20912_t:CDS:1 [Gigaspora rosea]